MTADSDLRNRWTVAEGDLPATKPHSDLLEESRKVETMLLKRITRGTGSVNHNL